MKVGEREGRSRARTHGGSSEALAVYWSKPGGMSMRSRGAIPHRSHSDARVLERGVGARPVLILQNRPNRYKSGEPTFASPAGMSLRRSLSASPDLERVRDWLNRNDFTQGIEGSLNTGAFARDERNIKPENKFREYVWAGDPQIGSIHNQASSASSQSVFAPPPPPPPATSLKSTTVRPQSGVGNKLDHHATPFASIVNSPNATAIPKLLYSSEMASALKQKKDLGRVHQQKPGIVSPKAPTTPSEKHFDSFLDSIFGRALAAENVSTESSLSGRRDSGLSLYGVPMDGSVKGAGAGVIHGVVARHSKEEGLHTEQNTDEVASALLTELKEKLKSKGIGHEQCEHTNNQQVTYTSAKTHIANHTSDVQLVHDDTSSDITASNFIPLASSTPPPWIPTPSIPRPLPYAAVAQDPSHRFSPPLPTTFESDPNNRHPKFGLSITPGVKENKPDTASLDAATEPTNTGAAASFSDSYPVVKNLQSPVQSNLLDWRQSSNITVEQGQTSWQRPLQQSLSRGVGSETRVTILVDKEFHWRSDQDAAGECADSQNIPNCRANKAGGVQTGKGFVNCDTLESQFAHNGDSDICLARSLKILKPERELDTNLDVERSALNNEIGQYASSRAESEKIGSGGKLPDTPRHTGPLFYNDTNRTSEKGEFSSSTGSPRLGQGTGPGITSSLSGPISLTVCRISSGTGVDGLTEFRDSRVPANAQLGERDSTAIRIPRSHHPGAALPTATGADLNKQPLNPRPLAHPPKGETYLRYYIPGPGDKRQSQSSGRPAPVVRFAPHSGFSSDEGLTVFSRESNSRVHITSSEYGRGRRSGSVDSIVELPPDSESVLRDVRKSRDLSYRENHHSTALDSDFKAFSGNKDSGNSAFAVSTEKKVGDLSHFCSNSVHGLSHTSNQQDIVGIGESYDKYRDDVNDDASGWTSSSSSNSDTNLQRFTSGAINQKTFTAIFAHGAKVSLRARADRTLTGSHHNLLGSHHDDYEDDTENKTTTRQSHSAPSSSRKKIKKRGRSLSSKKTTVGGFFDIHRIPASSAPIQNFEPFVNGSNGIIKDQNVNSGPAYPTTITINSSNNGQKVVRIYRKTSDDDQRPSQHRAPESSTTMLSSSNHDHEILPPSASGPNGKKGGKSYSSNSLLRSKAIFSSTPSLFTRSSPEEKFWKKEIKREKEEKKKLEKQEKKDEKLRRKSATLTAKNLPREWEHVARASEPAFARHGLRLSTVPVEYSEYTTTLPSSYPRPHPDSGLYAIPRPHTNMVATADLVRVEQVYGTVQRRPPSGQGYSVYSSVHGYAPSRAQQPRVVLLHRSAEGYGFVLRGAKSKVSSGGGFNDFIPTPEYPALQYLDSVDPGSQADRAGLKSGDFILEINGENVIRTSHEHVVHLIRSSSDVLTMKVVTVTHTDLTPHDWYSHQDSGAMTLPSRKNKAAPLPPQRDPRTSLSYSKASSKSATLGMAEIETLDAAIAEFDKQDDDSRSLHQEVDDPKLALVRASHTVKRVSEMDYDALVTGEPGVVTSSDRVGKDYMSPAEARIKKYHKRSSSQANDWSKSTPDIAAITDEQFVGKQSSGSWTKKHAPPPPKTSPLNSAVAMGGIMHSSLGDPEVQYRTPAPHIPEADYMTGRSVGAETENRRKVESSPYGSNQMNSTSIHNEDKGITFADERIMENAQRFIQKYPNASLLVTADVHSGKPDGSKSKVLYEPEPDYEDSDEDKSALNRTDRRKNGMSTHAIDNKLNKEAEIQRNIVNEGTSVIKQSGSAITVISISSGANKEVNASSHSAPYSVNSTKSSAQSTHNAGLTSPAQSISSSRRSSGVIMATPSQPSSAGSSRRSSVHSNCSGEAGDKNVRSGTPSSTSTITQSNSRCVLEPEIPIPPPPPPLHISASTSDIGASATLRRRPIDSEAAGSLQHQVSTEDILAAVVERQNRLENEGPRLAEVKTLPASKSSHDINHEALMAAVAKRKSRLEQEEDHSVVNDIEARLNRNKKLQAAKFFVGDVNRSNVNVEEKISKPPEQVSTPVSPKLENQIKINEIKPKNVPTQLEPNKQVTQPKLLPALNVKADQNNDNLSEKTSTKIVSSDGGKNLATVDFRAMLKPVEIKGKMSTIEVHSKNALQSSVAITSPPSTATGMNITTIVMTKANSNIMNPPPPPVPIAIPQPPFPPSVSTLTPKTEITTSVSKTEQSKVEAKAPTPIPSSPVSASVVTSPAANKSPADYIALAEKARQEYLKKKASGNLQTNIEKKGPVEITPNRKSPQVIKSMAPAIPVNTQPLSAAKINTSSTTNVGQAPKVNNVQGAIQNVQPGKNLVHGKAIVVGVTEDHSHTEQSLSNGTIKKSQLSTSLLSTSPALTKLPSGFNDKNSSLSRGVPVDIIPPPSSFSNGTGSPDSALSVPSFGQDDAASFISSDSSLSNLSGEQGEGSHHDRSKRAITDIILPPPPPPDFCDSALGDQDAFIPPPPQFLEIDSNGNESKTVDKNSKPFTTKSITDWSCMDVLDWLDSLSLPQYRITFAKACVDGNKLVNMGRNEFINLGITQVGHRMNLERSVKKFNMGASTNL